MILIVGVRGVKPTLHVLLAACARSGVAVARMTSVTKIRFLHLLFNKNLGMWRRIFRLKLSLGASF